MNIIDKWKDIYRRLAGKGVYPHEMAFLLDTKLRRFIITPEELAEILPLNNNSVVMELGPGPGYFSTEISLRIPAGLLITIDIQHEMLNKIIVKIKKYGLKNIFCVRADAVNVPLSSSCLDIIYMVTVLGEVSDPQLCMHELYRLLRPGGICCITEMAGDPDVLPESCILEMAEKAGLFFDKKINLKRGYSILLKK